MSEQEESENSDTINIITVPSLTFDVDEVNKCGELFQSWGLADATRVLLKLHGYVTLNHLKSIELEDINEVFLKLGFEYWGEKSVFKENLKKWRIEIVSILQF